MERELIWDQYRVAGVQQLHVKMPACVEPETTIRKLLPKFLENLRTRHIYVVGKQGCLCGVVRLNDIVKFVFPMVTTEEAGLESEGMFGFLGAIRSTAVLDDDPFCLPVNKIMNHAPCYVTEVDSLSEVARILMREKINELPVVDAKMHVTGQISVCEIIDAMLQHKDLGYRWMSLLHASPSCPLGRG